MKPKLNKTSDMIAEISQNFAALIESAPEAGEPITIPAAAKRNISPRTELPRRYRYEWERPEMDLVWMDYFERLMKRVDDGGIIALIGPRGNGKTRLAAEAMRNHSPDSGTYTTAMGLFLRIRASFGKTSRETEGEVVREMATTRLLILDEVQERGNTAWEDRLLTHILDKRYGAMVPTIVIANLTEAGLIECLGDSIISRLTETGGVISVDGPSHRKQS
jgi:DNA replication protein DnaC